MTPSSSSGGGAPLVRVAHQFFDPQGDAGGWTESHVTDAQLASLMSSAIRAVILKRMGKDPAPALIEIERCLMSSRIIPAASPDDERPPSPQPRAG